MGPLRGAPPAATLAVLALALALAAPRGAALRADDGDGAPVAAAPTGHPFLDALLGIPSRPGPRPGEPEVGRAGPPSFATVFPSPASPSPPDAPEPPAPQETRRIPASAPRATEPLAAFVPRDVAAVFLPSVHAAEETFAAAPPIVLPWLGLPAAPPAEGDPRLLEAAVIRLGLPPVWRTNPGVRTGLRSVAVIADDPDPRGDAAWALLGEIDDLSLLLGHRRAGLRWEDRRRERYRVRGRDAFTDDGTVRSHFAVDGGLAVFSTSAALRDRVLDVAAGRAPSMAGDRGGALERLEIAFRGVERTALCVLPEAFLAAAATPERCLRRLRARRCADERMRIDGASVRGDAAPAGPAPRCPSGGSLVRRDRAAGAHCSLHGTARGPVPLSDVPSGPPASAEEEDIVRAAAAAAAADGGWPAGALFRAAAADGTPARIEIPLAGVGDAVAARGVPPRGPLERIATRLLVETCLLHLELRGLDADARAALWEDLTGRVLPRDASGAWAPPSDVAPPPPPRRTIVVDDAGSRFLRLESVPAERGHR